MLRYFVYFGSSGDCKAGSTAAGCTFVRSLFWIDVRYYASGCNGLQFAAAPIAGESAVKIGISAFKMAMPSFLIAFCLAIQPELVMIGSAVNIVFVVFICLAGVLSMSVGFAGISVSK